MSKMKRNKKILINIICFLCALSMFFGLIYAYKQKEKIAEVNIKSRYTFSVDIDENGIELEQSQLDMDSHMLVNRFGSLSCKDIASIWISNFLEQYSQKYVPSSLKLTINSIDEPIIIDGDENICLITFSASNLTGKYDAFTSWNPNVDGDKFECAWVVTFNLDKHNDGSATISVKSISSPEDYGIEDYSNGNIVAIDNKDIDDSKSTSLIHYEIKNDTLGITYDGGTSFANVPIDINSLMMAENTVDGDDAAKTQDKTTVSSTELKKGSYYMTTTKTAFMYGGKVTSSGNIPVTIVYSNDMGKNWITSEISVSFDADYFYIDFFDENHGVFVMGYAKDVDSEKYSIYRTSNGGQDWELIGKGPDTRQIVGARYFNEDVGFFAMKHSDSYDTNLYITNNGGVDFSKVILEDQELDSTATDSKGNKLTWKEVYKDASVPTINSEGTITVYLTQGTDKLYNQGKTAAKYQSTDKGKTFKYIGQVELTN